MISGLRPWMFVSNTARSPSALMVALTSRWALAIISSMRAGWMRPSWISFSSASLATSRRTGSKLETVIVSGVSSMMRSQPVSVSMLRMLRPSRPMMRPFISSLGRATTETVISLAWSAAQRWMAVAMMSRARSSASSLYCASISLTFSAISWVTSSLTFSMR